MSLNQLFIESFLKESQFSKVRFLDNFYQGEAIQNSEAELTGFLLAIIDRSGNLYIKRTAFKILAELTIVGKISNHYVVLSVIKSFLCSDSAEALQTIALKYLQNFLEATDTVFQNVLIDLSDSADGDVASQAYFCLGIIKLTSTLARSGTSEIMVDADEASKLFTAAAQSTENRVDADFYIFFCNWIKAVIVNDTASMASLCELLKENLLRRQIYEWDEPNLELDYLIFRHIENLKQTIELASRSNTWFDMRPQIELLLELKLQAEKFVDTAKLTRDLVVKFRTGIFTNLEARIFKTYLGTEKERLISLGSVAQDGQLALYLNHLISAIPDKQDVDHDEDYQILAILLESLGSQQGPETYRRIMKKELTFVEAVKDLIKKDWASEHPFRTGSIQGQEILFSILSTLRENLSKYNADKLNVFTNILEEVIRYARGTFVGNERKQLKFLFCEDNGGLGQTAREHDLQDHMLLFFAHSKIADGLEHEKAKFVDGGRVDIVYKKDVMTIPIELKKSEFRPDMEALESKYISQAQTYTAGYDQLGIFVLLELSDKSKEPPPNFKDWFKIHHLPPSTNLQINYPDYVVSVVIPGNRTTPSTKSTYG